MGPNWANWNRQADRRAYPYHFQMKTWHGRRLSCLTYCQAIIGKSKMWAHLQFCGKVAYFKGDGVPQFF